MFPRRFRHLLGLLGLVAIAGYTVYCVRSSGDSFLPALGGRSHKEPEYTQGLVRTSGSGDEIVIYSQHVRGDDEHFDLVKYGKPVHEVFSNSTKNGKYFTIVTGDYESYNPSILAHPRKKDTWLLVAQQERTDVPDTVWFAQLFCEARFNAKGTLVCDRNPLLMPIGVTGLGRYNCKDNIAWLAFNVGPHDARAFWGPKVPYTIYGSQSSYNCFGIFIQDFRLLTDWGIVISTVNDTNNPYRGQTELQRPPPISRVEKNWFIFWDKDGTMHAHYDLTPKRVFAEIYVDGAAGPDLAPKVEAADAKCMDKYMPKLPPELESIHQATNSLSITLCKRTDPDCKETDDNTFIMHIFHHKTFYFWHGEYEPYVVLFRRTAPFALHGIGTKPIWIHGRSHAIKPKGWDPNQEYNATQMFYVTSISWKGANMTYHGYLDDIMFMGFGIEDTVAAAIDVTADDLIQNIGLCSEA